jgi:hypothetical protein
MEELPVESVVVNFPSKFSTGYSIGIHTFSYINIVYPVLCI